MNQREQDVVLVVDMIHKFLDDDSGNIGEAPDGRETVPIRIYPFHSSSKLIESPIEAFMILPHNGRRAFHISFENGEKRPFLFQVVFTGLVLNELHCCVDLLEIPGGKAVLG